MWVSLYCTSGVDWELGHYKECVKFEFNDTSKYYQLSLYTYLRRTILSGDRLFPKT